MKHLILLTWLLGLVVGCASKTTTSPKSAPVNPKVGLEFTTPIAPQTLKVMERRGTCPSQAPATTGQSWKPLVMAANACVQSKQWKMVEAIGAHLAQHHHLSPWGPYFLSLAAENRKEYPRALWMIELAIKKAPASGLLTYQQGRLYWISRDQTTAVQSFKKAIELDNRLADAHLVLGQLALIAGQTDEAGKRFQSALDSESRNIAALVGLAEVRLKKNDPKGATAALSQVLLTQPSHYRARLRQAQVLETFEKNFPDALSAYKRLRQLSRDRRLDAAMDIDIEGKIRELEGAVKQAAPNQLSARDPSQAQKGDK
jgi:tetratricopeptide (TPR) repeat protein